jgi:hypothetical protein
MDAEQRKRFPDLFDPVLAEIRERSAVADSFVDKELFRIYLATLWANAVTDPAGATLSEDDLEPFHDYLNERARELLGEDDAIRSTFEWLLHEDGAAALARLRVARAHRLVLERVGRLIVDPDGLRTRLGELRD